MRPSLESSTEPFLFRLAAHRATACFGFATLLTALPVLSQKGMDRSEKLAQKIRIAALESTRDIQAPSLPVDSLAAHLEDTNWVLIDVREDAEIAVSRIPRAMSPSQFASRFRQTGLPKTAFVIAYCTIGYRSGKFTEQLIAKGIPARYLEGGILAWIAAGHGLVKPSADGAMQPHFEVHVYSKEWNWVPPGYIAKW
jgi:rhodanese-related sulfurtransferase